MAARIKEAVPEKGATRPDAILAALYEKAKHGIPRCAGCGAKLRHVPTHLKRGGSTQVSAHFGLRKGHEHATGCKYDIDATLRQIVATSREVRDLGAAVLVKHVGSPEQGAVEFRLNVLLAGLESERTLGRLVKDPEKAYEYQESERRLSAYMNCVESIVMVADVIGDDAQLEEKVHIVFNGEKISWRDFFFGFKEHRRLWRARDKAQGRPITLEFERRDLERKAPAPYRANRHYQISGHFGREESDPPFNVQVQLQVENKALADAIWEAKQVVVCGIPSFRQPDFARRNPSGFPPFAHIILPIRHWNQVFAVGGGPLKAPPRAADEGPAHVASHNPTGDISAPRSSVPATGTPIPEAQLPSDEPPSEPAPQHPLPGPDEDHPPSDRAKAGDVPGNEAGEHVSSSGKPDPGSNAVRLDPQPVAPEARPDTEEAKSVEGLTESGPKTENPIARPDDGAAPAQTPAIPAETSPPTLAGSEASAPAARVRQVPEQKIGQPSPPKVAATAPQSTSVEPGARSRGNREPMTRAAKALKQRAAKVMERGRSAGRRFLSWFGVG